MNDIAKLRWQCRRGTLELDRLLLHYLDTAYSQANPEEQGIFKRLLQCEDGDLLGWLLGDKRPAGEKLGILVHKIRHTAKSNT
jgi:antitoxin CptB